MINDDFLEYISDASLAIEVYGNRSQGFDSPERCNWNVSSDKNETKTTAERYVEFGF